MKQVVHDYRTGDVRVADVPEPTMRAGGVLVRTHYSVISAGTERATLSLSEKSLVGKARSRPDLVKRVLETGRRVGIRKTWQIVRNRLDRPGTLGYSLAGEVLEVAPDGPDVLPGARVACAGVGYASHAEVVWAPRLLCAAVPDEVDLANAAYGTLGAIALHGVHQADVGVGDAVGVVGLGLVGQLAVRLLDASGCRVLGIDLDDHPVRMARDGGVDAALRDDSDLEARVRALTSRRGLDAVLITAASTSSDPVDLALELLRDRGRAVIVGNVALDVPRTVHSPLYEKEIELRVSRSYGPGRYDPAYEEHGRDYPVGYVRWTEQRNIQGFLQLMADGHLSLDGITTHTFPLDRASEAYRLVKGEENDPDPYLGVLLDYGETDDAGEAPSIELRSNRRTEPESGRLGVGVIGAGNFGQTNVLPHLQGDSGVNLVSVCTASGYTAEDVARKFGFLRAATGPDSVIDDDEVHAVYVLTRHDSHAGLVSRALSAGKAVYVEKPPALNREELASVVRAYERGESPGIIVGYNRRHSPAVRALIDHFRSMGGPLNLVYRVNAGPLPEDSWYLDPSQGGRFIGEGGHFVDTMSSVAGAQVIWAHAGCAPSPGRSPMLQDDLSAQFGFDDGSVGTVVYTSAGDSRLAKERLEVFGGGTAAVLDDYRTLTAFAGGKERTIEKAGLLGTSQDKGYQEEQSRCVKALRGEAEMPISLESLVATSLATFATVDSLRTGERIPVEADRFLRESVERDAE